MKIVFLHIPKTAGQSVTEGLKSAFGADNVSPIRSRRQVDGSCFQDWLDYDVFAGHHDWDDLYEKPGKKFVFSTLRDPKERVASFYFFLLRQARNLTSDELDMHGNRGKKAILTMSADDYFNKGEADWQSFVCNLYNNFYCSYFAKRTFRPGDEFFKLSDSERLDQARIGIRQLDLVCSIGQLELVENALNAKTGKKVKVASRRVNVGPPPTQQSRWAALCDRFESDKSVARLTSFTNLDEILFDEVTYSNREK